MTVSHSFADLRGFRYALEPLRLQRDWQLEQRRLQLLREQRQLREGELLLDELTQSHAQASLDAQPHDGAQLDPERYARSLTYLALLRQRLVDQELKVELLNKQYKQTQKAYFQAHQNLEAISHHRDLALQEHAAEGLRLQAIESDHDWLARRGVARGHELILGGGS